MIKKIFLVINTVKYLKLIQIYYRLYYAISHTKYRPESKDYVSNKSPNLTFESFPENQTSFLNGEFSFLNIPHKFKGKIDWNYMEYGMLWNYNLNYFDYLNQSKTDKNTGIELILDYINSLQKGTIKFGLDPYPISLRGINWIKFCIKNNIDIREINASLYSQYTYLSKKLEFHLLGNHLLENGFSLLFAAYYFSDKNFLKISKKIITRQLNEQILNDGAHFELSPMYHRIILHRLLDCYNLVKSNLKDYPNTELCNIIKKYSEKMILWLENMSYNDGSQPNFNDSTNKTFLSKEGLSNYSKSLGIQLNTKISLDGSGYRKITKPKYEMFVDIGNIGPDYQPGHAHSDTFNFEFKLQGIPIIVDTGISTYEKNKTRQKERSTNAHNTVIYGDFEQSEIWGGFRVGQRAKITSLNEKPNYIEASHNGYKKSRVKHLRSFDFKDDHIIIKDRLIGSTKKTCTAYFHLHPDISDHLIITDNNIVKLPNFEMYFNEDIKVENYIYSFGDDYNTSRDANCICVSFNNALTTTFKF